MTTRLDTKLLPKIAALLTDIGSSIIIFEPHAGDAYKPSDGSVTAGGAATQHTVKASPLAQYSRWLVDGKSIKAGDCRCLIAGQSLSFTPISGWKVTVDGITWRIVHVDPIKSGDDVCAYRLQLRS